jgi:hypothetical protein
MRYVHGIESAVTLLQEFLPMDKDKGAIALGRCRCRDVGEGDCLAGACRGNEQGTPTASPEGVAHLVNGGLLIGTEVEHVREGARVGAWKGRGKWL